MNTPAPKVPITKTKKAQAAALLATLAAGIGIGRGTHEETKIGRAHGNFVLTRANGTVEKWEEDNVKTKVGIDKTGKNAYSTSMDSNGMNYVLCSADAVTETADSTALTNEIATNGFTRAQGTYTHTNGTGTFTISKTFTATGAQTVQKCALSDAASGGTVNHIIGFTPRSLQTGDQLAITYTITLSKLDVRHKLWNRKHLAPQNRLRELRAQDAYLLAA